MTYDEAKKELNEIMAEMGGNSAPPFSLRERIEALYMAVCRKTVRRCNCRDRYADALAEIYRTLKYKKMNNSTTKLRRGVVIWWKGAPYSVHNITDRVAKEYLAKFPGNEKFFEVLPPKDELKEEPKPKKPAKKAKK